MCKRFIIVLIALSFIFTSCLRQSIVSPGTIEKKRKKTTVTEIDQISSIAKTISSSMDDRLLLSQLIISGVDGRGDLPAHMINLFKEIPPGGVMLFSYNLNTSNDIIKSFVNEMATLITNETVGGKHRGVAPFVTVDHEGGGINRFLPNVTRLPAASSYWKIFQEEGMDAALARIEADSKKTANDISALGFNVNFAPVAEYTINENRNFLSQRSYGPDPVFTARAAAAFIKGMEQSDMLCVIKHFPGVAGIDPHFHASVLNLDITTLKKLVYPFEYLINNGARAVMSAHTIATAVDRNKIATFSPIVMQNWLRGELGFKGITISDDLNMRSIGNINIEDAAVEAIIAGIDMVLIWPNNLKKTYNALHAALQDGRLTRERLLEAVNRILYEKIRMGLVER